MPLAGRRHREQPHIARRDDGRRLRVLALIPFLVALALAPTLTASASPAANAIHPLTWSDRVVADSSGAQMPRDSSMPCVECHDMQNQDNPSIYGFSTARTGGATITTVRQLCTGCHHPSDAPGSPVVVRGLVLLPLPGGVGAHTDADTTPCSDCHGSSGHQPTSHNDAGLACEDPACHGGSGSHPIHLSTSDPRGPGALACTDCHEADGFPYFAAGSDGDGSGHIELDEATVCDGCHSPGGGYDGVDSTGDSIGAKTVWDTGVYETTSTLAAGNEKWCVGCHDGDSSIGGQEPSLISGVYAAPVGGDPAAEYLYGTGWGYYETGHGLATSTAFPSSGGVSMGAGIECDACHEYDATHIDGNRWTYAAGGGSASYRDGFRLIQPDLGGGPIDPMLMPRTQTGPNSVLAPEAWALCAACHDSSPFLSGGSNDTNLFCSGTNEHRHHMSMNNIVYDSDHTGGAESRAMCITCHNVHGSTQLAMMRDGKVLDMEPGMSIWYWNSSFSTWFGNNTTPPDPENLTLIQSTGRARVGQPTFCGACHNHNYIDSPHDRGASLFWDGDVPALDWTFEDLYVDRGINTDRIFDTTYAPQFRVEYFDPNNDAPASIAVWIDHDDDGSFEASETTSLVEDDSGDTTYTDGKIYKATIAVTDPGDGTMTYRFLASDGTHDAVGQPVADQTLVWDTNLMRDVPSEYASIQDAIDAAYDGNTILVADGSYDELLDFDGKDLALESVNGTSTTSIIGNNTGAACVTISSGATSATIEGFTIDNQYDSMGSGAARGVVIQSGVDVTIRDCVINDNNPRTGNAGAGIYLDGGGLILENTQVTNNWSMNGGAGVYAINTTRTISFTDCAIDSNSGQVSPGVYLSSCEATAVFTRTSVSNNDCSNTGAGIDTVNSPIELYDCNVDGNDGGDASGEHGAGIRSTGTDGAVHIEGGSISGNYTGGNGGGVYVTGSTAAVPLSIENTDMTGNRANNGGGAVYLWDCTNMSYLSNIDMDGCQAQYSGGAVYTNSPITITDATMDDCRTTHGGSGGGGAIRVSGTSGSLTLTNVSIADPISGNGGGGGINVSGSTAAAPFTAANVSITGGYSGYGGGIRVSGCTNTSILSSVTVDSCSSYDNGGGIRAESGMTISDSTITNNWVTHAPENGGGIYFGNASADLTITDTNVDNNECDNGAGIYASAANLSITGGTINGNHSDATGPGYNGGGLYVSGAAVLDSVYIQGNKCGQKGGGVYSGGGSLAMTNCTVTGNHTGTHTSSLGGGIYSAPAASIVNCTVSANFSRQVGGIYGGGGTVTSSIVWGNTASLQYSNASAATVSYSDVSGTNYTNGGNNIDVAPGFVTTSTAYPSTAGDFHLRQMSPCEGAATSTGAPADDIDGEGRPQGSGHDQGSDEIGGTAPAMRLVPAEHTLPASELATEPTDPHVMPGALGPLGLVKAENLELTSVAERLSRSIGVDNGATQVEARATGKGSAPGSSPLPSLPATALGAASLLALAWKAIVRFLASLG